MADIEMIFVETRALSYQLEYLRIKSSSQTHSWTSMLLLDLCLLILLVKTAYGIQI